MNVPPPPPSFHIRLRRRTRHDGKVFKTSLRVHAAVHAMDLFHRKSFSPVWCLLRDPRLLEEETGALAHVTSVTMMYALLAGRGRELYILDFARRTLV